MARLLVLFLALFSVVHSQGMYSWEILKFQDFESSYSNTLLGYNTIMQSPIYAYSTIDEIEVNGFNFNPFVLRSTINYLPINYTDFRNIGIENSILHIDVNPQEHFKFIASLANETGEPLASMYVGDKSSYNKFPRSNGGITGAYGGFFGGINHNTDDLFSSSLFSNRLMDASYKSFHTNSNNSSNENEDIFFGFRNERFNIFSSRKTNKSWIMFDDGSLIRKVQQDYFMGLRADYKYFYSAITVNSSSAINEEALDSTAYSAEGYDNSIKFGWTPVKTTDIYVGGGVSKTAPAFIDEIEPHSFLSIHVPDSIKDDYFRILNTDGIIDDSLHAVERKYIYAGFNTDLPYKIKLEGSGSIYDKKLRDASAKITRGIFSLFGQQRYNSIHEDFVYNNGLMTSLEKQKINALKDRGAGIAIGSNLDLPLNILAKGQFSFSGGKSYVNRVVYRDTATIISERAKLEYMALNAQWAMGKSFAKDSISLSTAFWKDLNADKQYNYPLFKVMLGNTYDITNNLSIAGFLSYITAYDFYQDETVNSRIDDNLNLDLFVSQYLFKRKLEIRYEFFGVNSPSVIEYPTGAEILRRFNFMFIFKL